LLQNEQSVVFLGTAKTKSLQLLHEPAVFLFTGHLLDSSERHGDRFPYTLLNDARSVLKDEIRKVTQAHKPAFAITSLAAGGDMIFAQEMLAIKVPLIIFLPFEIEKFLRVSVTYAKRGTAEDPDPWARQFHSILQQATAVITTGTDKNSQEDALRLCNEKMLAYALEKAANDPKKVLAFALVKSDDEIKKGGSSEFIRHIKAKHIRVKQLWPQDNGIINKVNNLEELIPSFAILESKAIDNQKRWKWRFHFSLAVLATIAFFDAFVTAPDRFFFGYGKEARIFSLISSVLGAFITLRLQVSDKTRYRNWTENRAKVEQIRSEIWYFLFDIWSENNRQGTYTRQELKAYISRLDNSGDPEVIHEKLLEQLKTSVEKMTIEKKINYYRDLRLQNQITYFNNRSKKFVALLRRYKLWTLFFLLFSVGWGALKMVSEFYSMPQILSDFSPLGMMISFIALVSTYVEANNMNEMEFKYSQMAKVLRTLWKEGNHPKDHESFINWVKECEIFLRTQNNEWSLKRET
jgi:hypothetical protein